ncbi:MAG: GFA family protein [Methyloligellaceae bacterium]
MTGGPVKDLPIEGGCLCGAVRYRASAPPLNTSFCHCRLCQRASGAPVVAWVTFAADDFAVVQGEPAAYASSAEAVRQFCGRCGTQLTFQHRELLQEMDVTGASLDAPDAFPPRDSIWSASRRSYVGAIDKHLKVFEEGRDD